MSAPSHARSKRLSNGLSHISIGAEEALRCEQEQERARRATGLVFRQYMVRGFDRAVSTNAIVLYGRLGAVSADFRRLPADVWPLLEVADWENGVAVARQHGVLVDSGRAVWCEPVTGPAQQRPAQEPDAQFLGHKPNWRAWATNLNASRGSGVPRSL